MSSFIAYPAFIILKRTFEPPPAKQLTIVEEDYIPLIYRSQAQAKEEAKKLSQRDFPRAFYAVASFELVTRV